MTTRIALMSSPDVLGLLPSWLAASKGRTVCLANVYTCMLAYDMPAFRRDVNSADLVLPDGRPLVWALSLLGMAGARQVRGFDLMLEVFRYAQEEEIPIGFLGGAQDDLVLLRQKLRLQFPGLRVNCAIAPPFRPCMPEEDAAIVDEIESSGIKLLFVFLGCPKQERWMAEHRERLSCCMFGVGAALNFYTGAQQQAPRLMQRAGLEWLFRLLREPHRLWKRYLIQNPRFLWHFFKQWRGGQAHAHSTVEEERRECHTSR